ncbi:MAG: FHA domain-containing protein [Actinobacteria bacterium]|nr:MAG: FHA domain-containing protein [Actinomycetota bacterium]
MCAEPVNLARAMLTRAMAELVLEIVEGPGAGRQLALDSAVVIGRAQDVDFVLEDDQVSRHHARVTPSVDDSAVIEDLGSANGTFVNHNELHGPTRVDPSDELLLGVTVMELRSSSQVSERPTVKRPVPPALAQAPRPPDYVDPEAVDAVVGESHGSGAARELEKYRDVRVRRRAQLAPLALLMLIALALIIYFAVR